MIHDLRDLLASHEGERATKYREVLSVGKYCAAVDCPVPGYNRITFESLLFESEVSGPMSYKCVEFCEATVIEKLEEAFTRREFASFVL